MTIVEQPIKERMWRAIEADADGRGRVATSPEEYGKRFGLNGHDLAKNLDQLRKEGFIDVRWRATRMVGIKVRRGRLNDEALRTLKPAAPTLIERVRAWVESHPEASMGAWVDLPKGYDTISDAVEGKPLSIHQTARNMARSGDVEIRHENRRVTGIRLRLPAKRQPPRFGRPLEPIVPVALIGNGADPEVARNLPEVPATPALAKYVSARRIARLAPADNPYLTVTFVDDPIAEEGLALSAYAALLREELSRRG